MRIKEEKVERRCGTLASPLDLDSERDSGFAFLKGTRRMVTQYA